MRKRQLETGMMGNRDKPSPGKAKHGDAQRPSLVDAERRQPPPSRAATTSPPSTAQSGSPAAAAAPHLRRRRSPSKPRAKTLSRRLNSVEAFFAWGAEVKGAFSIGLCVQLREAATAAARNGSGGEKKKGIDADLLRAAACEASLLDQPLARALTVRAASFSPFALPRVVLPRGAPPPEFLVLRREGAAHWEREMERACNRPFRSEEVALLDGSDVENEDEMTAGESATKAKKKKKKKKKKRTVRGQRACSFVLLLNEDADAADADDGVEEGEGGGEQGSDSGGRHHELVVRFHHALFDGKAAVAFVGAVLRRYEAKVAAREEAEEIAAAVAAALAAAAENDDNDDNDGGASTPERVLSPLSSALSSSPISPLARWPSVTSTPGAFDGKVGGGDLGSLSPEPRLSPSLPPSLAPLAPPPPPRSYSSSPSSFTSLPPSTSALSIRLGPRAFFTRIVSNVMLMHEGLALARKGLGLKLPISNGKEGSGGGGGGGGGEAAAPPTSFSEERCAVSTFALSAEETRAFLRSCRLEGTSANSALAAAALASAAAVGEVSERSGGLSLQTHFDLRGHLRATGPSSSSSSSSSRPSPPVGLCSFSEIKWFPLAAFDDAGGEGEGEGHGGGVRASSTRKLWEFARRYGKSVRAAGKVPEGAGFLQRLCGPWRMAPPLTFRLQVVPHILKETAAAHKRGEAFSSVDMGLSNLGKVDLLSPDAARTRVPFDASRPASAPASCASLAFFSDGGGEDAASSRSASPAPPFSCESSLPPAPPSLATRGLFFVAGGQHLGPTIALNAATAAGRLCLVAMTRQGGAWPLASSSDEGSARERVLAEVVRRVRAMAASASAAAALASEA